MENFISLIKEPITHDLTDEEEQIAELLWSMDDTARGDLIANHICDPEEQVHYLRLIYHKSKSAERIKRTLEHTTGYKPIPDLKAPKCEGCAQGDSRRHGLSSKRSKPPARVQMARTGSTEDEEHDESDEEYDTYSTSSDDESDERDTTRVVARRQPKPHAPRFNLETLRPWEVHFCDNKEFGHRAYGDPSHAFLVVDMATRMAHVVDVKRKSDNGKAVKSVWAYEGVLTLPYHCTCYADGCGSMRHVEQACHSSVRIRFEPTPPHEQSLNEAENLCDQLWATARSMILARGAPPTVENFAVKYACYVHIRMSTTESRGWKTPLELCTGAMPDISHLRPFWSVCYVHVPKSKRAALKRRGLGHIRGERGRFVGFHSPRNTTYAVLLDNGHLVHSLSLIHISEPTRPY